MRPYNTELAETWAAWVPPRLARNVAFDLLLILGGALAVGYGCAGLGAAAIALALYPFRVRS